MIDRILVAVDGSDHASRAVDFAAELAREMDAELTIVTIVAHGSMAPMAMGAYTELQQIYFESRDALEGAAKEIIDQAAVRAERSGVTVSTRIEFGSPSTIICELVEDLNIDAIVMGRRGLGDLGGLLLGSVTHRVAHNANCTVITVK